MTTSLSLADIVWQLSTEQPVSLLFRLSIPAKPGEAIGRDGVVPEPTYGTQFNNAAVSGVTAEGKVTCKPSSAISRAPVASASPTVEFEVPKSMPQARIRLSIFRRTPDVMRRVARVKASALFPP